VTVFPEAESLGDDRPAIDLSHARVPLAPNLTEQDLEDVVDALRSGLTPGP